MGKPENIYTINELISNGKLEAAKKKCKKNFDSIKCISLYIKILIMENNYEEAKELCKKHLDSSVILSQYAVILINEKNYEEAKELFEKNLDKDVIIPQYIEVLYYYNDYNRIDEIVKEYPYNRFVARSHALGLYRENRLEEAIEVCDKFYYDKEIFKIYDLIMEKLSDQSTKTNKPTKEVDKLKIHSKVLGLIKDKKYEEAKELSKHYLDDKYIFDLYISILEKERIKRKKILYF